MAIIQNYFPSVDVDTRINILEQSIDELVDEFENFKIDNDIVKSSLINTSLGTAFKNSLVFKNKDIESDNIWKGDVTACYEKIIEELKKKSGFGYNCGQICYFGATSYPEKRLIQHRITQGKNHLGFSLGMNILYYTSRMEKAANMETRLISRYGTSLNIKNIKNVSCGLSFGRPTYYVYMLRHFIRK